VLSLNCFVKEKNWARLIYERLRGVYGDAAWVSAVLEGGWNILRTETRTSPISRAVVGQELLHMFDFFGKRGNDQWISLLSDALQTSSCVSRKTSEEENCHMTTRGLTLHVWLCRQFNRTAGNCSPSHVTVRTLPPQTTTCLGPRKITWEVTTTRLSRQSRKPCEAGCEELESTCTAEISLRFCNADRNA
jgi:hypothetical protein